MRASHWWRKPYGYLGPSVLGIGHFLQGIGDHLLQRHRLPFGPGGYPGRLVELGMDKRNDMLSDALLTGRGVKTCPLPQSY